MAGEMYYDLNYNLIDKKVVAVTIGGKKQNKLGVRNSNIMMSQNLKDRKSGLGFMTEQIPSPKGRGASIENETSDEV
jgi:prolyl-tRNA synthetase